MQRKIIDMRVRVCERKRERERGSYTYEHKIKWGMINYIKKCHQVTKIPTMRARVHMRSIYTSLWVFLWLEDLLVENAKLVVK